jgi:hypothetical protein
VQDGGVCLAQELLLKLLALLVHERLALRDELVERRVDDLVTGGGGIT